MTDQPDHPDQPDHSDRPDLTRELDPATERQVRDLLAAARHTGAVPTGVAARLDAALAGLVAERRPVVPSAPVVDLDAARHRRRRLTTGLVAAAAVVVAGAALPSLLDGSSGSDSAVTADESATDSSGGSARELTEPAPDDKLGAQSTAPEAGDVPQSAEVGPVPVDPERFRRDALLARDASASYPTLARQELCGVPPEASAAVVPVQYDDLTGYLVFAEPDAGRQRVDLYLCTSGELTRTTTLPAP
jgi:hypothetical protein